MLAVKDNQSTLLSRIRYALDAAEHFALVYRSASDHREVDKGHGRIETRRCLALDFPGPFEPDLWPGLQSIPMVESTREIGDTVTTGRRYYVSSLPADAVRIAHAVRAHWGIESMHWVLDVTFNEDQCRTRLENAAQNFAILRRIATTLIRRDNSTKAGIRIRRLKAGASDDYRAQLLGLKTLKKPS
ncbi:transposase IS4 family protein [Burkholderia ambifaria MEX-5]|uniref:Transposase IS4 family protein n=1 Tax=Burkholderia ambifaria MEX-5 TaxID=396597 RepID=B1TH11_9BURK|nr:transposase IS4 family protein [Burkholderia ambifaria MEX-5]